ncbi:MAG: TRAP transporter small permease [Thermodesulfobacteriota bacterium]
MNSSREMTSWARRLLDGVNSFFLFVMVAAIFLQVVARYGFNHALSWPEELGRFLFAWIVFLGTVSVIRDDEMLNLDLLYQWIPKKVAEVLRLIVSLVVLGFLLVMMKGGYELMVRQASQRSVGLEIPMGVVYLILPLGTFFMSLAMVYRIVRQIKQLLSKNEASRARDIE